MKRDEFSSQISPSSYPVDCAKIYETINVDWGFN